MQVGFVLLIAEYPAPGQHSSYAETPEMAPRIYRELSADHVSGA